jgi:hypothetical protein
MGKSDALSRQADHGDSSEDNRDLTLLTPNFFMVRALEELEVVGQERDLLQLIRRETKGEELEDTVKQAVKALKSTSTRSICSSEWTEADGVLYFRGKIYVPPTADIRRKIVALHHDSHVAGHPGRWKTLELVTRGINKQIKIKGMSEVFRQLPEVIGSASAVRSTKRTAEVIPERLAVAEERKEQQRFVGSDFARRKGSPLTQTERVKAIPLCQ